MIGQYNDWSGSGGSFRVSLGRQDLIFDNLGVFLVKFDETVLVVRVKLFARTMEQVQLKFFSWLDIRTFAFGQASSVSNIN